VKLIFGCHNRHFLGKFYLKTKKIEMDVAQIRPEFEANQNKVHIKN